MLAGPPVDLSDLPGGGQDPAAVHEATERIMERITALVARLRGEPAPAERFEPQPASVEAPG